MTNENKEQRYGQWQALIEEQKQSNLTQKEFCNRRNLVLSQFVYYRSQIKEKNSTPTAKASHFSPVKVSNKEKTVTLGEIKLSLPNGFQCAFPSNLEITQIKRLVEALLVC